MRDVNETKLEAVTQLKLGLAGGNIAKRQTMTGVKDGAVMQLLNGSGTTLSDMNNNTSVDVEMDVEDADPAEIDTHAKMPVLTKDDLECMTDEELYAYLNPFFLLSGNI